MAQGYSEGDGSASESGFAAIHAVLLFERSLGDTAERLRSAMDVSQMSRLCVHIRAVCLRLHALGCAV